MKGYQQLFILLFYALAIFGTFANGQPQNNTQFQRRGLFSPTSPLLSSNKLYPEKKGWFETQFHLWIDKWVRNSVALVRPTFNHEVGKTLHQYKGLFFERLSVLIGSEMASDILDLKDCSTLSNNPSERTWAQWLQEKSKQVTNKVWAICNWASQGHLEEFYRKSTKELRTMINVAMDDLHIRIVESIMVGLQNHYSILPPDHPTRTPLTPISRRPTPLEASQTFGRFFHKRGLLSISDSSSLSSDATSKLAPVPKKSFKFPGQEKLLKSVQRHVQRIVDQVFVVVTPEINTYFNVLRKKLLRDGNKLLQMSLGNVLPDSYKDDEIFNDEFIFTVDENNNTNNVRAKIFQKRNAILEDEYVDEYGDQPHAAALVTNMVDRAHSRIKGAVSSYFGVRDAFARYLRYLLHGYSALIEGNFRSMLPDIMSISKQITLYKLEHDIIPFHLYRCGEMCADIGTKIPYPTDGTKYDKKYPDEPTIIEKSRHTWSEKMKSKWQKAFGKP